MGGLLGIEVVCGGAIGMLPQAGGVGTGALGVARGGLGAGGLGGLRTPGWGLPRLGALRC